MHLKFHERASFRSRAIHLRTLLLLAAAMAFGTPSWTAAQDGRPNILFVFLDDATYDEVGEAALDQYFPNMRAHLQESGTRYTNFHVVAPLCAPSRGSLFRGQYPHNSGVKVTASGFQIFYDRGYTDSEIGMWMKEAGYSTALVGKYCHEQYPLASRDPGYQPPGWDEFHATLGGKYFEFPINSNGLRTNSLPYPDEYRTDVERDTAASIIEDHDFATPLFLYVPVFAPHFQARNSSDPMVAPRHAELYSEAIIPRVPSFNEPDVSDKTPQYAALPLFSPTQIDTLDEQFRNRLRSVKAVDELVGDLVSALSEKGQLDNTYIFLTSDNGFQQGHHRDAAKKDPFDRTTRVQLLVRGPGVPADYTANHLLAHIDLPATFLSIAGAPIPGFMDGRSFLDLLPNPAAIPETDWRTDLLVENTEPKERGSIVLDENYVALRMYDSIYVEWNNGDREYYDLSIDPFQLENIYFSLDATRVGELEARMNRLRNCRGPQCNDQGEALDFDTTLLFPTDTVFSDSQVVFEGNAFASGSVSSVELVIRRIRDRAYWNGAEFVGSYQTVNVPVSAGGATSAGWSYVFDAPVEKEDYWMSARTTDESGEEAPEAATAFFRVDRGISDTVDPTSRLTDPAPGSDAASPVTFSGETTDDLGVSRVELVVRDLTTGLYWSPTGYQAEFTSNPTTIVEDRTVSVSWQSEALPLVAGRHYVGIRAYDQAGNGGLQRESVVVTGESVPPQAALLAPQPGSTSNSPVEFSGIASDGTAVASVDLVVRDLTTGLYWNGSAYQSGYVTIDTVIVGDDTTSVSWYVGPYPLAQGRHYIGVRATDTSGNRTRIDNTIIVGNAVPPAVSVSSPQPDQRLANPVVFSGTATDSAPGIESVDVVIRDLETQAYWNGSGFQSEYVRVPARIEGPLESVEWSYEMPVDLSGRHYLGVFATDGASNRTREQLSFVVDDSPQDENAPIVTFSIPQGETYPSGDVSIEGFAADDVGIEFVEILIRDTASGLHWNGASFQSERTVVLATIDAPGGAETGWSVGPFPLPDADYYFNARAVDSSGNAGRAGARASVGDIGSTESVAEVGSTSCADPAPVRDESGMLVVTVLPCPASAQ